MYEDNLLEVNKPSQYIGGEWNSAQKDFRAARIKFAISFPDLYEVGMSNLGLRIIYGLLNNIPDVACERFFAPAQDMEEVLRTNNRQILSLESRRKLSEFDLVGFSLGSELDYTNVLNILDLGATPLKSASRDRRYPLIIGGGPCSLNPEPMHEFFDLFVIGEAEELIPELIGLYRKYQEEYKSGVMSKEDLLLGLAQIEGVYVPAFYEVTYDDCGRIKEFAPKIKSLPARIKKRYVKDLNLAYYPRDWIIPHIQIIHDRITLEIMRGCPHRCRFCQARSQYFPLRYRQAQDLLGLAEELYRRSGYEEISLAGLSVSDHPQIEEILKRLMAVFEGKAVSLSLPSVKANTLIGKLSALIAQVKKTSLTFAPEAGSQRLRDLLAKDFNDAEFFKSLEQAYASGYQHVKLYFMIGLPTETEADLDAIIDFSLRASELRRNSGGAPAGVNISINTLIPKPHTALQWFKMQDPEATRTKQEYLRHKAKKHKRLNLSFHNREMSFLEGVLSRGDRRLSAVVLAAFLAGAKFDAWGNHFRLEKWLNAFKDTGLLPQSYLAEKKRGDLLPWDFIDTGVDKEALGVEFQKTVASV